MSVIIKDVNGNAYKIVLNFSESQSMSVIILTPPNPPKYCGHFWKIFKKFTHRHLGLFGRLNY